ncbi:molybdate ABC transporter substrate-binding protein [Marinomonas sp. 2405UD68-3]|uniref:molybdate ABC transporter substrate-binding protein n=1 Tax=Marinomonas sp. 2405UD68-3 TaxID=3391835 RepID=UPI0039C97647
MRGLNWLKYTLFIWLSLLPYQAQADSALIAVASNFTLTMKALIARFHADTPHTLRVSFASSGKLYAQIKNGAPFDLLLSADQVIPQKLLGEGNAVPTTQMTYAVGKLALWSSDPTVVDAKGDVLHSSKMNKLALANPKLAPYGFAAIEVLKNLNVYASTKPSWVQGENIGQTYQFVRTGNANLGFVALSQVHNNQQPINGSVWEVPDHLYSPIKQDLVVLNKGKDNAAVSAFLKYLNLPKTQKLIQSYGYHTQ